MALSNFIPEKYHGPLLLGAGIVLLLHTLGIFERGLSYLLVAAALYMIIVGFIKMDGVEKIRTLVAKQKHKKHE